MRIQRIKRQLIQIVCILALALAPILAACGSKTVTLRFETGGGTVIEAIEAKAGEDISDRLPDDPTREGYLFGGWYLEPDASGERQTLPSVMPKRDTTYHAKWDIVSPALLTLLSNDGGTLETQSLEVPAGVALKGVLEGLVPTDIKEGLTFAGWYRGDVPIAEGATMPANGLTLTAKYRADYTLTLFTEHADGSYTKGETTTGSAFYGEPFDANEAVSAPEHYFADAAAAGAHSETASLGAHEHFDVYLSLQRYHIFYLPNAPEGETSYGEMDVEAARYGGTYTVAKNAYTMSGVYRFLGWATSEDGEIEYRPGDEIVPSDDLILHAKWQRGYGDLFGGGDHLFISETEADTVYLIRGPLEERKGTYDPQTGVFEFREEGEIVLDGRVTADWFYWFTDTYERTYPELGGDAVLTLLPHGLATYREGDTTLDGIYEIDLASHYFAFRADEGDTRFLFNLLEPTDGGELVFRRQDLGEEGYYYDPDAKIVLYLDGLGGLEYHYNRENYEYVLPGGIPVYTANGYYEWNEESGLYLAYTRDLTALLKQFTFKFEGDAVEPEGVYEGIGKLEGCVDMDDGLRASYSDKWGTTEDILTLDGYGNATYGGEEGQYTLITWLYVYEEEDGDQVDDYLLVRYVRADGGIVYFRLDLGYGEFELDRTIAPSEIASDIPHGRIGFVGEVHTLNDFFSGFLYIFENGDAEFWSQYGVTNSGDVCYVLYTELISTVKAAAEGRYTFERSVNEFTGGYYENAFDFTVENGIGRAVYPDVHNVVTVAEKLTLDFTEGVAKYDGVQIDYGFNLGHADFYTFVISRDPLAERYFVTTDGKNFTEVFADDMYDIAYAGGGENEYTARLLFAGEKVYLGLLLESNAYRYIGEGTVTEQEGCEHFALTRYLDDFTASELEEYADFDFRREKGENGKTGTFIQRTRDMGYENLKDDGFGAYTFTDGEGHIFEGTLAGTLGALIFFETDGETRILTAEGKTVYDVTASDAGFGYKMDANWSDRSDALNALQYQNDYLVLNGRGSAVFYHYVPLEGRVEETRASYVRTAEWADGYREYEIRVSAADTRTVLLAAYPLLGQAIPFYQERIEHRIGDYDVIGGGHVQSKGYPNLPATYVDARGHSYEGNMYRGRVNTGIYDHSFISSDDIVRAVRFAVYENGIATGTEFLFDITGEKLALYTLAYGDYALADRGYYNSQTVLRLDGRGGATLMNGFGEDGRGTYSRIAALGAYLYEGTQGGEEASFVFRISTIAEDDGQTYVYELYREEDDRIYVSDEGWAVLRLDGFGDATLIGRYGTVREGIYAVITEGLGFFSSGSYETLFTVSDGKFALVDNSAYVGNYYAEDFSAVEFGPARMIVGGTAYYYTVSDGTVTRYSQDGTDTIPFPAGDTIALGGRTYRKLTGEVTFRSNVYADELTLTFTPGGAAFLAEAVFTKGGIAGMGYSVSVSYRDGELQILLIYDSGEEDTVPESYALGLRFTGTDNTFTVKPAGEQGTFRDSTDSANTLTVDGLRIGQFLVTDSLKADLKNITDMDGRALTFDGKYSDAATDDTHNDYTFGYGKELSFTAGDGRRYTLRFFLDTKTMQFITVSVTLEKTFEIEGIGEATVIQLVKSGRDYAGRDRLEVVGISVPGNNVEETVFNGLVEDNKAMLVRSTYNTTTGAYSYEVFCLDLTVGADGLVEGAAADGRDLRYAEAARGISYTVTFVYTAQDGFDVCYLLAFKIGDRTADAQFTKNGDGSWTVTAAGQTYSVRIMSTGFGFRLVISRR